MDDLKWEENPACDDTGRCKAPKGVRLITNCVHCGKELHEINGVWFTYDADKYDNPVPQDYVA